MSNSSESSISYIQRIHNVILNGLTSISINLGKELGLFRVLAEFNGVPATSQQIADAADCKERYVRDWLNACATAELIDIDAAGKHYWLTKDCCDAVTSHKFEEVITMGPFLEMFYSLLPKIASCFKKNGPPGLGYDVYEGFAGKMANFTRYVVLDKIASHIVPLLPAEFRAKLDAGGMKILDVACGSGGTTCTWAQLFPKCSFVGIDISEEALKRAREQASSMQLSNTQFVVCNAVKMDPGWSNHFDMVMINQALHDIARADLGLKEIYRVLKPGGFFLMNELDAHTNAAEDVGNLVVSGFHVTSYSHCTTVSLSVPGSLGLGLCWGREKAKEMVEEAGFEVAKQGHDGAPMQMYIHALKK